MANEKNLKPIRSASEAREKGKKGGQKSGESRRQKKLLKECMSDLLDLKIKDKEILAHFKALGIKNINNKMLITFGLFNKAAGGNVEAFKEIRNLIGEDERNMDLGKIDEIIGAIDDAAAE